MTAAREEVLRRIRLAAGGSPRPAVPRGYRQASDVPGDLDLLVDRLVDYGATVTRTSSVADALAARLGAAGTATLLVPDGVEGDWLTGLPLAVRVVRDVPALSARELDEVAAVVTGCALAVAETGTIVLDHGAGQGRRAVTLVPDHHLVVVREDQVVRGLVEAVAALDPTRPMTWISGPSATSDIELNRVEGVHGPRRLDVLVVG